MDQIDEDAWLNPRSNEARLSRHEDFTEFDDNNSSGLQKQHGYYRRENLTGAAYHGDIKRVEDILKLKFGNQDINQTEGGLGSGTHEREMTPLGIASWMGDVAMQRLLIRFHADVNGSGDVDNYYTATPLFAAVKSRNKHVVQLLIDYGADVNSSMSVHVNTGGGSTAMYYAAKHGLLEIAKQLYRAGACVTVPGGDRNTPCDIALANNHVAMVDWLRAMSDVQSHSNERDGIVKSFYVPTLGGGGRCYHS